MEERKTMPLSNKEYYALLHVFGIVNILDECLPILRRRLELVDAKTDMDLVQAKFEEFMDRVLKTIEPKKLISMRKDLDHIVCECRVAYDYAKRDEREFTYCPTEAIDKLVYRVMNWECLACDKNAKEAKKCPIFNDFDACFSWDQAPKGDACPWAGWLETAE